MKKPTLHCLKKISVGTFSIGSLLMLGTSLGGTAYVVDQMDNFQPERFPNETIVIDGKKVPYQRFYQNMEEKDGQWFYRDKQGKLISLNDASDYTVKGDLRHRAIQGKKLNVITDTVNISRNSQTHHPMFSYGSLDSLQNMPSMGYQDQAWTDLHVRYFQSSDPKLNAFYQPYNDSYNCTERHETQHFLNAQSGMKRSGQSYETKFSEVCMDEVSANLAQLLEQRKNYLKTGDLNHITDRFKFYREWLVLQTSPLSSKPSEAEQKLIATGVFEAWKKDKYEVYVRNNASITRYTLSAADYNGCVDHPELHKDLMNKMFTIDGMSFYQHIEGREKEFADMLPQDLKEQFQSLTNTKKEKMRYMEKVGQYTQNDPQRKNEYFSALQQKRQWDDFIKKLLPR